MELHLDASIDKLDNLAMNVHHCRKAVPLMEAQSYTAEQRRAANQVWAAAGA